MILRWPCADRRFRWLGEREEGSFNHRPAMESSGQVDNCHTIQSLRVRGKQLEYGLLSDSEKDESPEFLRHVGSQRQPS